MTSKFIRCLKDLSLISVSSLLLVLSFPDCDLGFLAWVALLPLLITINGRSLRYGFFLSLVCGMLFFLGMFRWILEVPKYTWLHHTLLAVYLGSYFGFFGLIFVSTSNRLGTTAALFAAPLIWVSLEWVRSNLDFLALPWGLLAHSQYQYPIIIQIASITGAYGISFLIVLVNAAIATVVYQYCERFKIPPRLPLPKGGKKVETLPKEVAIPPPLKKGDTGGFVDQLPLLISAASFLFFTLLYGWLTITKTITGNKIKISLVQGNIPQERKWDPRYAKEITEIYSGLTQNASKNQPDLIIWPETATPGSIGLNPNLFAELISIVRNAGAYVLLGSAQHRKFEQKSGTALKYTNSAFLIDPEPRKIKRQQYDKIRLFPFGEYLPYKDIIPWSIIKVRESSEYVPGKEFTVFEHPACRFGVTICWENAFPDLFRQFVKRGAQLMINLTNEAHFGKTAAPHQLVSISILRAVENRIYVVRCANTGVSCIIDPYGRIVDRVKDGNEQDIFVRGVMSGWIIPLDSKTLYTQYGDWLVWVAMVGSVVFLIVSFFKKGV